jgi:uncharacterized protein YcfJ
MKKILTLMLFFIALTINLSAESFSVRVTQSTPIYKTVYIDVPYTTYEDQEVSVPYNCGVTTVNRNDIGLDTVIGTVLGVVIGNQVGRGNGRIAAKIGGGLGGGYLANQMRHGNSQTCYRHEYRSRPVTSYHTEKHEKIVAYKNCGYVDNRYICKRTKRRQRFIYLNY